MANDGDNEDDRGIGWPGATARVLVAFINAGMSAPFAGTVGAIFLGYVFLLPVAERSTVGFDAFTGIMDQPWFWIGLAAVEFLVIVVLMTVGGLFARLAYARLWKQGTLLKEDRDLKLPERLSSDDPEALRTYEKRVKASIVGGDNQEGDT